MEHILTLPHIIETIPLSLDLHAPGFDFTLLHDFRERFVAHEAGQRFLDTFLATCKARG